MTVWILAQDGPEQNEWKDVARFLDDEAGLEAAEFEADFWKEAGFEVKITGGTNGRN